MKIAISASGNSYDSYIDSHFARCKYFIIYDNSNGAIEFLPNPNIDTVEDAGILTVDLLKTRNVEKVIACAFGVKVKPLLDSLKIQMIVVGEKSCKVKDIIEIINKSIKVMPKMDGTGPDGKGAGTGRGLGRCGQASQNEKHEQLGKGLGKKRKTGNGQEMGKGKRLQGGSTK